ncbi:hypothetical protein C2G38_336910 [Gigaspora rosea]|uniref:Uncharacterized protein n=1 Tax=Gigaspora rosea TaxID=44941 RepID=A0A397UMM0_9GLOM|nr:hypothetical protein C2G38_336910 [Gigaspora rosea]
MFLQIFLIISCFLEQFLLLQSILLLHIRLYFHSFHGLLFLRVRLILNKSLYLDLFFELVIYIFHFLFLRIILIGSFFILGGMILFHIHCKGCSSIEIGSRSQYRSWYFSSSSYVSTIFYCFAIHISTCFSYNSSRNFI